jgi:hypothetical protein
MTIKEASPELPIWPAGVARFADGILEVTTGDGIQVAAGDIVDIGVEPPRAGRRALRNARAVTRTRTRHHPSENGPSAPVR